MPDFILDVHLSPGDLRAGMVHDVRTGLSGHPKWLPPKYFYDARGSELFEAITRLPEYYPTRAERAILERRAEEIASAARADTLVELGSGSSQKTRLLLDGLAALGTLRRYVPVDVSPTALEDAMKSLSVDYPDLGLHGMVGDFEHHLGLIPSGGTRLVAFLGGTVGNLAPGERRAFFAAIRNGLAPQDSFLLGTDLVKDPERLVRAYDDAAGVTAEFNRNVLHVLNNSLGADFAPEAFSHVAVWNQQNAWIEMRLRSIHEQSVTIGDLGLSIDFGAGEEMRTEISAKFTRARLEDELAEAGFALAEWWTDPAGDFAISLARPI